ncbi:MAG TPA: serine/threonine-protein kinase [Ktedonobacterales bacterium]|nr:serine/threonine-protein kinase [Ktedonobacterales bacterium]
MVSPATGTSGGSPSFPLADRYRVVARVGLGGTAVVYRCVDLHTERIVAVKVLRASGPLIPEAAARFRREAHLAATLTHPHIVRVLDYGYTVPPIAAPRLVWADEPEQQTVPYLAMEYVYGSTLKELVRRLGPLPLDWVWRLGAQLCSALATAHAGGVVHRDVKPQNVMILDSKTELLAKLTDFGIARQVGSELTTLTATGQVIGTPDYLSPEQVIGEPGGPSSDLYALGVVLYELATARLPFEADTPLAAASRRMIVDAPPPTIYRRDIPAPLQDVILLALRRDATQRFADATELAQALRWSRERSPAQPVAERGTWVLPPKGAHPSQPLAGAAPSSIAHEPDFASREEFEVQSTVLRVAPAMPGIDGDDESPVRAPDASNDTSGSQEAPAGE